MIRLSEWLADNPTMDVELDLEEGDVVSDLMVIARAVRLDLPGMDALIMDTTEHTTGIVCHGMLTSAVLQHDTWMINGGDD